MKGWKQIFESNGQEKQTGVPILISNKIDVNKRAIETGPEGHFIILKGRIHQEDINNVNIYDIDSNTIIVGNFNIPLSKMDRSSQKISKKILWH